jgi:hypothetical protein
MRRHRHVPRKVHLHLGPDREDHGAFATLSNIEVQKPYAWSLILYWSAFRSPEPKTPPNAPRARNATPRSSVFPRVVLLSAFARRTRAKTCRRGLNPACTSSVRTRSRAPELGRISCRMGCPSEFFCEVSAHSRTSLMDSNPFQVPHHAQGHGRKRSGHSRKQNVTSH